MLKNLSSSYINVQGAVKFGEELSKLQGLNYLNLNLG